MLDKSQEICSSSDSLMPLATQGLSSEELKMVRASALPKWLACWLACLAIFLVLLFYSLSTIGSKPADQAGLHVDEQHLNLGTVWADENLKVVLPIQNRTNDDLEVLRFETSCNCTSIEPPAVVIPAHTTETVNAKIDFGSDFGRRVVTEEPFEVVVIPVVHGYASPISRWRIRGTSKAAFTVEPSHLDFGRVFLGDKEKKDTREKNIKVVCSDVVDDLAVDCNRTVATTKCTRLSQGEFDVQVTPNKDLQTGRHNFEIVISALSKSAGRFSSASIPAVIEVVGEFQLLPSEKFHIGASPVGTTMKETLVLLSRSGAPFVVEKVVSDSSDITIGEFNKDAPDGIFSLPISIAVNRAEPSVANISFHVRRREGVVDSQEYDALRQVIYFRGVLKEGL